jgi:hypothetical protein
LHSDLKPKGIYVEYLSLGVFIKPDTRTDPKYIADAWYEMYNKKEKAEDTLRNCLKSREEDHLADSAST